MMSGEQTASRLRNEASGRLVVALDVGNAAVALNLARQLWGHAGIFKVGLELFSAEGPALVNKLIAAGAEVFLDLKLHDIPNTVRGAAREAAKLGVRMITVHGSGGGAMMQAALEGAREGAGNASAPMVLGVTILTSLARADLAEIGWGESAEDVVLRLARLAQAAGLGGVVASAREAERIRNTCGAEFGIVTPGIRPATTAHNDQARAATAETAIRAGADFLVVGRPITQAPDPAAAADAIVDEIVRALAAPGVEAVTYGRS